MFTVSVSQPSEIATAGVDYTIDCDVSFETSSAAVQFEWLDPDGNAVPMDEFITRSTSISSELEFNPARESQAGVYTCLATVNGVTINESSAEVEVQSERIYVFRHCGGIDHSNSTSQNNLM